MLHTFSFITLGCKVNQYDTQAIREQLLRYGMVEVSPEQPADVCIVNTCTVTAAGDAKSRKYIRRMATRNPDSTIVVTGCSVDADADASLAARLRRQVETQNLLLVPNDEKINIPRLLGLSTDGFGATPTEDTWSSGISSFEGHTRAFIKIEDGCDNFCSYCIVPYVRGRIRSRPVESIVAEARRLVDSGYREIVLTGIHLGAWGRDTSGELADVVENLDSVKGIRRLRLSSLEALEATDRLIELAAGGLLCPHFHLPLQSGSDAVLRLMNRNYTAREFVEIVQRIKNRIRRPAITTDVLVGFPGETDAHFRETEAVCREAGFSRTHIFPYSERAGTAAAKMPGKVQASVITARKNSLAAVARETALAYKRQFIGETVEVMVETAADDSDDAGGYTERYMQVEFPAVAELRRGEIVRVKVQRVTSAKAYGLTVDS